MSERTRNSTRAWALTVATALLLCGCGQTGKLYLPERGDGNAGEIVTRPAQTPPPEPGPTANSPQSADSPPVPDSPAPEVTEPEDGSKKRNGAPAPSTEPPNKN